MALRMRVDFLVHGQLADMPTRRHKKSTRPRVKHSSPDTDDRLWPALNYINSTWLTCCWRWRWLTHTTWTPPATTSVVRVLWRAGLTTSPQHSCTFMSPASLPAAAAPLSMKGSWSRCRRCWCRKASCVVSDDDDSITTTTTNCGTTTRASVARHPAFCVHV